MFTFCDTLCTGYINLGPNGPNEMNRKRCLGTHRLAFFDTQLQHGEEPLNSEHTHDVKKEDENGTSKSKATTHKQHKRGALRVNSYSTPS
jgi:hypothetical protein